MAPLKEETAAENALIPHVLRRGTQAHPDMESISAALDELYGGAIEPAVRKKGETLHRGLSSHMTGIVRDMIVSRVAAYRRLYTGPRQRVADYETSLAPLQQRQSEIFRQLRSSAPHV